jgi:hypothetical protein
MVRPLGFEPRTCGLRVRCSAVELEAHVAVGLYEQARACPKSTTQTRANPNLMRVTDGARTRDFQYHKLTLYQLSYDHHEDPQSATDCHDSHNRISVQLAAHEAAR